MSVSGLSLAPLDGLSYHHLRRLKLRRLHLEMGGVRTRAVNCHIAVSSALGGAKSTSLLSIIGSVILVDLISVGIL